MESREIIIRQQVPVYTKYWPDFTDEEDEDGYRHIILVGPDSLESDDYDTRKSIIIDGYVHELITEALGEIEDGEDYEPKDDYDFDEVWSYDIVYDLPNRDGVSESIPYEMTLESLEACKVILLELKVINKRIGKERDIVRKEKKRRRKESRRSLEQVEKQLSELKRQKKEILKSGCSPDELKEMNREIKEKREAIALQERSIDEVFSGKQSIIPF